MLLASTSSRDEFVDLDVTAAAWIALIVLIVLMLGAIGLIQLLVGERRLRRPVPAAVTLPTEAASA